MNKSLKQWGWMLIIWAGSVTVLTIFAYLLRFILK